MTVPLERPATVDGLFLWVLHRFAEEFEEHAVVKGGIALKLLDCPRSTTAIDYVFVPYDSETDVASRIGDVLREIDGAQVDVRVHSRMIRAILRVDEAAIQIEASVDLECGSTAVPTASFANFLGQPSRIVRVVALEVALANKLAAWNERRLLRDLYDVYYLVTRLGARVDLPTLVARLARVQSRLPAMRKRRTMTVQELGEDLLAAAGEIDQEAIRNELAPVLPPEELVGLDLRLRAGVVRAAEMLGLAG